MGPENEPPYPHESASAALEGFSSSGWTDNAARMHKFMKEHPEVKITTPPNGQTSGFRAVWPGGDVSDASLGWLMDKLEQHFRQSS